MANFEKYKARAVGHLLKHNNREADDGSEHSNKDIDPSRTALNYHLRYGTAEDVRTRLDEIFSYSIKECSVVLAEFCVTLPADVGKDDARVFFQAAFEFMLDDLGDKNVINAVVHMDEASPHMHLDFVPCVVSDDLSEATAGERVRAWKETHEPPYERLCCKEKINRRYLASFHDRLSDYVQERLGYRAGVLNGATAKGRRTVLELKNETLEAQIREKEDVLAGLQADLARLGSAIRRLGLTQGDMGLVPLMDRIAALENANGVLRDILTRNGYSYTRSDMERMKAVPHVPSRSAGINAVAGSLADAGIDGHAAVVIELYDRNKRRLPQERLISGDGELERTTLAVMRSPEKAAIRKAGDRLYLYYKADSGGQAVSSLMELAGLMRAEEDLKGRRIYIEHGAYDEYGFARNVLQSFDNPVSYYTGTSGASGGGRMNEMEKGTDK